MIVVMLAMAAALQTIHGDFDHDGKRDTAQLVRRGGHIDVVIHRGAAPQTEMRLQSFDRTADVFLDTAKPGRWKTACGKGLGAEDEPCPRKTVVLRGDTLDFGVREATEMVAIWTGRRFEIVSLSD